MAGDWFPMGFWRSRCPEVVLISSLSGRARHEVLGWLCDLWSWVSSESADGHVLGVSVEDLPSVIGADTRFWEAVVTAQWLADDDAGIVIPGWENWLSESAKKRSKERSKKRAQRSRSRPKSVPKLSPKVSPDCPPEEGTTEQDITEQKKEEGKTPPTPDDSRAVVPLVAIPPELDTEEFRAAWGEWKAERRERGTKAYTPRGELAKLRELAPYGPAVAIASIRKSIANTWAGLFPESVQHRPANQSVPRPGKPTAADAIAAKRAEMERQRQSQQPPAEGAA